MKPQSDWLVFMGCWGRLWLNLCPKDFSGKNSWWSKQNLTIIKSRSILFESIIMYIYIYNISLSYLDSYEIRMRTLHLTVKYSLQYPAPVGVRTTNPTARPRAERRAVNFRGLEETIDDFRRGLNQLGVSENRLNPWTQWFCWSLSLLNGYFIGNIPYFRQTQMSAELSTHGFVWSISTSVFSLLTWTNIDKYQHLS